MLTLMLLDIIVDDLPLLAEQAKKGSNPHTGAVGWAIIFGIVIGYELWATLTHHQTLSQSVQNGPTWFKWTLGCGLGLLIGHLFVF